MSKSLSLTFALISTVLMAATAVMISFNLWLTLLLAIVTVGFIGFTFVLKARLRRKQEQGRS